MCNIASKERGQRVALSEWDKTLVDDLRGMEERERIREAVDREREEKEKALREIRSMVWT